MPKVSSNYIRHFGVKSWSTPNLTLKHTSIHHTIQTDTQRKCLILQLVEKVMHTYNTVKSLVFVLDI